MKIAIVSHYFESHRGGVEIVAGALARSFARLGHRAVWLACDATPPPDDADGVAAVALPASNALENRLGLPLPFPRPAAVVRLFRAIRGCDGVLVHDALYPTSALAFLAARLWRKPVAFAAHARATAVPHRSRVLRLLIALVERSVARPLLARADRVAFVGETTAQHYASVRFRAPPVVIHNGVETAIFRPAANSAEKAERRRRFGLPEDRPVALFVGRFVALKGLDVVRRMAERRPDIIWALAGWGLIAPDKWGLANVRVFANLRGATLAPLYQAADVFVLPSVGEGMPLVVQEALACGLPIVCGDETAQADPAARGLLTSVAIDQDADATATRFYAAVDCVLADPADGDAAARFRFAAERYSWDGCGARYLALLDAAGAARARHVGPQPCLDAPPPRPARTVEAPPLQAAGTPRCRA
jgi:alpha-maltose-1-phosphate synthase